MPVCPYCGHDTADAQARFCPACGRSLADVAAEQAVDSTSALTISVPRDSESEPDVELETTLVDPAVLEKLAPGAALLVVAHGPATGARFLLDSEVTSAGRHPNSDIFLDDITVSRRHADFMKVDDGYHVRDVGSLNGTYVNRSRIDNVALRNGDEVQIGKYRMVFFARTTKASNDSAEGGV